MKEIAQAFYKDNEDQRFTNAPPNKEGYPVRPLAKASL